MRTITMLALVFCGLLSIAADEQKPELTIYENKTLGIKYCDCADLAKSQLPKEILNAAKKEKYQDALNKATQKKTGVFFISATKIVETTKFPGLPKGGWASLSKLCPGILSSINGKTINDHNAFDEALATLKDGQQVIIEFIGYPGLLAKEEFKKIEISFLMPTSK